MTRPHTLPARRAWPPDAGTFALRLVRNGWRVPAAIVHENGLWYAIIDGERGESHTSPEHAPGVERVWTAGIMVGQAEYDWLVAVRDAARVSEPDHPSCHPRQPIRPNLLRPLLPTPAR